MNNTPYSTSLGEQCVLVCSDSESRQNILIGSRLCDFDVYDFKGASRAHRIESGSEMIVKLDAIINRYIDCYEITVTDNDIS